jgi:hypothetical protein
VVTFKTDGLTRPGQVRILPDRREVALVGASQGELRRAMVVFLRLLDRRYPHVSRFFPLRFRKQPFENDKPVPIEKWAPRKPMTEFFQKLPDARFLAKPILRKEYESLYANDNFDFQGKYSMRFGAYMFEPTYGDDFVYGYEGRGGIEKSHTPDIESPEPW